MEGQVRVVGGKAAGQIWQIAGPKIQEVHGNLGFEMNFTSLPPTIETVATKSLRIE